LFFATASHEPGDSPSTSTGARMSWTPLLKRVFAIDITTCPQCSVPLTLIAVIEEPAVIVKILRHLRLLARPPPKSPARLEGSTHGFQPAGAGV